MTPEQELDAAMTELERAVQRQVRFWQRPMNAISREGTDEIHRQVESARSALRALFAERVTLRAIPPKDLGAAIPQSAILEAGRPKPLKVDP